MLLPWPWHSYVTHLLHVIRDSLYSMNVTEQTGRSQQQIDLSLRLRIIQNVAYYRPSGFPKFDARVSRAL